MRFLFDALLILLSALASWFASYFGSYMKKKGENLATHEDINKLVDQVSAVTQATKDIEARISGDLWNRQKRWEIKRDVLLEAGKQMIQMHAALVSLAAAVEVQQSEPEVNITDHVTKFLAATNGFDEARLLVAIVASERTRDEIEQLRLFMGRISSRFEQGDLSEYRKSTKELWQKMNLVKGLIRIDLEIDAPNLQQEAG